MIDSLLAFFDYPVAMRALLASTMVGIMCGILGCFIVLRNMALIGDALAHAVLPGVVVAFMIFGYNALGFFSGSVVAGLAAAAGITWVQHNSKTKNDAAIGIVFTAMFALGVILISWVSRNEGVHLDLKDFLFGNILGVSDQDLIMTLSVGVFVVLSVIILYRYLFITTFQPVIAQTMGISVNLVHYFLMLMLSFTVVASLQTVGVILVVSMLITPASTALLVSKYLNRVIIWAAFFGLISAVIGLFLAVILETTPGPAMAVVSTVIYLGVLIFAPGKGLIAKYFSRRKFSTRILDEDVIKRSYYLSQTEGRVSMEKLASVLSVPESRLKDRINKLSDNGLIEKSDDKIRLTEKGVQKANALIRAHRLWETYLVDKMGLDEAQIHDEAEVYEHLLTNDLLDRVDETLGYPRKDPHGSPIPHKEKSPATALIDLRVGDRAVIAREQSDEATTSMLWKLGLTPETEITVEETGDQVRITAGGSAIEISRQLANKINVVNPDLSI